MAVGLAVGALLVARIAGGPALSGLTQSSAVVGSALLAVPVTQLMTRHGRRPGLVVAYASGALGALLIVFAAMGGWLWLMFVGMFAFGGGMTASLQARYVATDLAAPVRRGWYLSIVVWATTVGSVAGPNLAAPADELLRGWWPRFPELSGPFVFSGLAFAIAAALIWFLLHPDPLLLSRSLTASKPSFAEAPRIGVRAAARIVLTIPSARLGIASMAVGHAVMVGIMSMTPVHIGLAMQVRHGDVLRVVGLVLSAHIAGMYALSPVVGWATDRLGRVSVMVTGFVLLLTACAVIGTSGQFTPRLTLGLALLGLGWSCTMISGSTLLSESVPLDRRPAVQGLADLTMGLAGAAGGALSGAIMAVVGYPALSVITAVLVVPVLGLALRTRASVTISR